MRFRALEALTRADLDLERLTVALPSVDPAMIPVHAASRLFRVFWLRGISAVAMPWGIYVHPDRLARSSSDVARLIVHELAHIDQWRRLGPIGWTRSYVGDYLRGRRSGKGHRGAYRAIGLEEEARDIAARLGG